GRPTPINRRKPSARSRWSCSTPSADINGTAQAPQQRYPRPALQRERARNPVAEKRADKVECADMAVTLCCSFIEVENNHYSRHRDQNGGCDAQLPATPDPVNAD